MTGKPATREDGKRRPRFAFLLNTAQRRLQKSVQDSGDAKSPTRFGLLMALRPNGDPVPMAQLGQALDLGAPALSGLIERMLRDGLITKEQDPADGRAWNIGLTESGVAMRAEAVRNAREMNERLCEGFDENELEIVARWLEAVRKKYPKEN